MDPHHVEAELGHPPRLPRHVFPGVSKRATAVRLLPQNRTGVPSSKDQPVAIGLERPVQLRRADRCR